MFKRLYTRLAVVTCLLFIVMGGALVYITAATSELHTLEVTQRVNREIAIHAAEDMPLLDEQGVNQQAIQDLMHHVMFINPIVEVYLLDTEGRVLSHALPYGTVLRDRVDMQPLQAFLDGDAALPIFGDDPRSRTEQKVFSVSPIMENGETAAYVYTVLNGAAVDGINGALSESYNLRMGLLTIIVSLLVALLAGIGVFFLLTRRLKVLADAVRTYREGSYQERMELPIRQPVRDELDELMTAVGDMSQRIDQQFSAQQEIDRNRRDLIANVSHDLRTPIASIQGYLETVLLKDLDDTERREYLETAHKHCRRLNELIGELFELSRLESRTLEPDWEAFPVMELIQDIVHEHELMAREKNISLTASSADMGAFVYADMAMIHRVLENLIRNALRHTPRGGEIAINVRSEAEGVRVEVVDNGEGIASHEIPHIFDRFYRPDTEKPDSGHGLGLAIVKRIVELHRSTVAVRSALHEGTSFSFCLPQPA
ncbi:MAG: ATP-binding protein [Pseudomonadota bacterium]